MLVSVLDVSQNSYCMTTGALNATVQSKERIELTLYKYVLMFHATKDLQNKIYFCPPPPKKKVKTRNERGKGVLRDEIIVRRGLIVEVK